MQWKRRPSVDVYQEGPKRNHLPRADVSLLISGALVLNQRAFEVLGEFLGRFGQLLELKVDGAIEYFYNVTNIVDCIDQEVSQTRPSGSIVKEAFHSSDLPSGPVVFKDPRTAGTRIYVDDDAKALLEREMAAHCLTGLEIVEPGAR